MSWVDRLLGRSSQPTSLVTTRGDSRVDLIAPLVAQRALTPDLYLAKAYKAFPVGQPARRPRSRFYDPMGLMYSLGYKDRRYSLTYDTLRKVTYQLGVIAAIIAQRTSQVAQFAQPFRNTKTVGFEIRHKDPDRKMTRGERDFCRDLEAFTMKTGAGPNTLTRVPRADFEGLLKMSTRDSLTFDQVAWEIVPDSRNKPYEVRGVDSSSVRIAADDAEDTPLRQTIKKYTREEYSSSMASRYGLVTKDGNEVSDAVDFVQVINGRIENIYTRDELAFLVRNPRTDLFANGYGFSEIEQLILIVTSHLFAEEFNRRFFMQGAAPKGIINIKGENIAPDQVEAFKRQWQAQVAGVENAWRTPILQSEGFEYHSLHETHKDSEYMAWMEYLIKVTCACYLIDPAEINFDMHGGVSQTPLFESANEHKLKESKDTGLRPLLRFFSKAWNKNVIDRIDDHFHLEFLGLDELSETDKLDVSTREVQWFKTVNEIRNERDLPDIEGGDIIMNPTWLQMQQQKQMQEQMEQQQQFGGDPSQGGPPGAPPEAPPPDSESVVPLVQQAGGSAEKGISPRVLRVLLEDDPGEVRP